MDAASSAIFGSLWGLGVLLRYLVLLGVVGWFVYSLIDYLKAPKSMRRSRLPSLILSVLFLVALGCFLLLRGTALT